ncbi:MAG TPA: response regulator [Chryseosolibacter sp.]|nr:response regulator [Chryseosolibacter sp.]
MNRILVVEDTSELLANLTDVLKMEGYSVKGCRDVKTAMEYLSDELPDLVITDLTMPDTDGFQFISALRASDAFRHLRIAIFSARPRSENIAQAMSLDVMAYIQKPCPPDELVLAIDEVLKSKHE